MAAETSGNTSKRTRVPKGGRRFKRWLFRLVILAAVGAAAAFGWREYREIRQHRKQLLVHLTGNGRVAASDRVPPDCARVGRLPEQGSQRRQDHTDRQAGQQKQQGRDQSQARHEQPVG